MRTALHVLLVGFIFTASTGLANAQIQTLQLDYQSVFDNYSLWKPWDGERDWVGANQNVGKIGGWQHYAREPYLNNGEAQPMQDSGMGHDMSKMKKPMNPGEAHKGGH
jgi:hypothetical protein